MLKILASFALLIVAIANADIATAASKRVDERAIVREIDTIEQARIDEAASSYGALPEGPAVRRAVETYRRCLGKKSATSLSCHDSFDVSKGCKGLGDAQCKAILAHAWELFIERYEGIIRAYIKSQQSLSIDELDASNSFWNQHKVNFCPVSAKVWTSLEPQLATSQMYRDCLARLNATRADELRQLAFEIRYVQALASQEQSE